MSDHGPYSDFVAKKGVVRGGKYTTLFSGNP